MGSAAWTIPLSVDQPKFASPLDQAAAAAQVRSLAGAAAIQRQAMQENELKLQSMRENQADQETLRGAFGDQNNWTDGKPDYDKIRQAVAPKLQLRNLQALDQEHLSLVKGLTQMQDEKRKQVINRSTAVGNELMGLLQTPTDQRQNAYLAARQRLIQSGDITADEYPDNAPLDDQSLNEHLTQVGYATNVAKLADQQVEEERKRQAAYKAAAQARQADAAAAAKETQQQLEDAARGHLAVTDQAGHDQWLADLKENSPEAYKRFQNLKTFNEDTQDTIQNMALTAEQRSMLAKRKADIQKDIAQSIAAGGLPAIVVKSHDPTLSDSERKMYADSAKDIMAHQGRLSANAAAVQGRFDQREADAQSKDAQKDSAEHTKLRGQEIDLWRDRQRLGNTISEAQLKNSDEITDPKTGRKISIQDAQTMADAAADKAANLQQQMKLIRQRHGWGEFGQQGGAAATPPLAKTAPVQSGQTPKLITKNGKTYSEGQQVKLRNGQTVTITKINGDGTFQYR